MLSLKKSMGLVLTGLLASTVLAGCGSAPQSAQPSGAAPQAAPTQQKEEISLYFTGSQNTKDLMDTLVNMFQQQNPNIKVNEIFAASGQGGQPVMDRLLAAKKAGQSSVNIDLVENGDLVIGEKEGLWAKLDQSMIPNLSKVDPAYLATTQGLAVAYRASSVVLAYNSKNVPNPPKTAQELYDWIKQHPGRFAYNDPSTGGAGSSFVQTAIYNFLPPEAMLSSDPKWMQQWDKGFQLLKDLGPYMYQKGVYPKKNQGTLDILANGEVDMIPAWSDMGLQQLANKTLPDTVKLTQIEPAFTGGPAYFMIPVMSQHQQAAAKFINFTLTPEAQAVVINKMYGYPGIKWSEMPADVQARFASVASGYRQMNISTLGAEINKRWQKEVAGQ